MAVSVPIPVSVPLGTSQGWFTSSLPIGVPTTVFSYTVPPGNGYAIFKASLSGMANGLAQLQVNGTAIDYLQIVWTTRADERIFPTGHIVAPGGLITVLVTNMGEQSENFFGSVQGSMAP